MHLSRSNKMHIFFVLILLSALAYRTNCSTAENFMKTIEDLRETAGDVHRLYNRISHAIKSFHHTGKNLSPMFFVENINDDSELKQLEYHHYPQHDDSDKSTSHGLHFPKNCANTHRNGILNIQIDANSRPFKVLCEQDIHGGGWTVVLQRHEGLISFHNRTRLEYKNGFGNFDGEFFLGLNKLHALTYAKPHEVIFITKNPDFRELSEVSNFDTISVENAQDDFEITMHGNDLDEELSFSGNKFCSHDKHKHCKTPFPGWNSENGNCHLFAPHISEREHVGEILCWHKNRSMSRCEPVESLKMLIRPVNSYIE